MDLQNLTTQELIDLHIAVEDEIMKDNHKLDIEKLMSNRIIEALSEEYVCDAKHEAITEAFETLTGYCLWDEDEDAIPLDELRDLVEEIRLARRLNPLGHITQSFEVIVKQYAELRGVA